MRRKEFPNRPGKQSLEPRRRGSFLEPWESSSPSGMMRRMTDEIDRAFERIFPGVGRRSGTTDLATFSPEIDMFERDGKLVVRADLPGMTRENVTVDISEEAISIEGERKYEHEEKEEGIYHSERSYGHFSRQIPLPDGVDPDTATATFRDGVLEIALDASEMKQTRRRVEIGGETTGTKPEKAA